MNKIEKLDSRNIIFQKLEAFIKKYYTNELIRGVLLFVGFGLLYFLFTLFVEYFLWLKPAGRTFLFWTFIVIEIFLLSRFILFPLFKLFKFKSGIDYEQASAIIGSHFSDVNDKLINFLQLSHSENADDKSELLIASIEQKARSLQPIPFGNAIDLKRNKRFLPLALFPVIVLSLFYMSGNSTVISQSLNRVVNFNSTFLPPAPFKFVLVNKYLETEQNKDFTVRLKTVGNVVPEDATIFINDESYFMESTKSGEFQFKISNPSSNVLFHVEANGISSQDFQLKVMTVPSISNFEMTLHYPSYLNKKSEIIKGTGNAIIPEGTKVSWKMNTLATESVVWKGGSYVFPFYKTENFFFLTKYILQNIEYQIFTSNNDVKNHEKLSYQLSVIKDQYPTIKISAAPDSLKIDQSYVLGQISDDYGLSKLQVVYYERDKPQTAKRGTIAVKTSVFDQFVFAFPGNLPVEQGTSYDYYFEVFDNDGIHNHKSTKSTVYSNRVATQEEREDQVLKQQNDNINGLEKSLKSQDKQISAIEKIQKSGKEKEKLEFNDQQKVNEFVERQKQQDQLMKDFAEKMKANLDKFKTEKNDPLKEELKKRLEKAEAALDNNQKLLDELKSLNEKIKNEELLDKLDKFKQNSKNQTKNLAQLVELTKRFYVDKKMEQLAEKLNKLSDKQDKLSESEKENSTDKQNEINESFDKIQEELKDLEKDNKELKSPMDIPNDAAKEKSIDDDLKKAKEELQKQSQSKAKPKQKSASKKMKEMSMKMEQSMEGSDKEQLEEDVKMLRQILDNLLAFSLSQEDVMLQFKGLKAGSPSFNKNIKIQQNLKQQFKHVDDSLFAMSLRVPKIAEDVTKEIGNVHYNLDKSLETLSDSQIPKGLSHQQYTISAANKLADFLSEILNGMQMSMSGMGAGKPKPGQGQGMQLPDIIKKQEALGDKMKKGMEQGKKPGEGQKPGQGEKGKNAEGKNGNNGEGDNGDEGDAKAILEIYKEQKQLREALQNELNKKGLGGNGQSALEQMKQIEKQLLNKGFKNETLQKILNVKQELLKLNSALQQQGEENKREAESSKKDFNNHANTLPPALLEYLNSIEILNRQSLPLRSNFNQKVQEYFNKK